MMKCFIAMCFVLGGLYGLLCFWDYQSTQKEIVFRTEQIHTADSHLHSIKIVVASDFHIRPDYIELDLLRGWVDSVNAQKPDFIFLLGDFIDGRVGRDQALENYLIKTVSALRAKKGIYIVFGNHDWYYGPITLLNLFKQLHVKILKNQSVCVDNIYIVGVGDYMFHDQYLDYAMRNVPDSAKTIFLLSHHPGAAEELKRPITLAFAGHTHGGQILPPFFKTPIMGCSYTRNMSRGFYQTEYARVFVTSGIGNSVFNIRINVQPETIIFQFLP